MFSKSKIFFVISTKFNGRDRWKPELRMINKWIHRRGIRLCDGVALVMCWKHAGVCRQCTWAHSRASSLVMCLLWKSHLLQINTPFTRSSQGSGWAGTAAVLPCRFQVFAFSISPLCTSSALSIFLLLLFTILHVYPQSPSSISMPHIHLSLFSTFLNATILHSPGNSSLLYTHFFISLHFAECFAVFLIPSLFMFSRPVCICVCVCESTVLHTLLFTPPEPRKCLHCSRGEGQNDLITLCH